MNKQTGETGNYNTVREVKRVCAIKKKVKQKKKCTLTRACAVGVRAEDVLMTEAIKKNLMKEKLDLSQPSPTEKWGISPEEARRVVAEVGAVVQFEPIG